MLRQTIFETGQHDDYFQFMRLYRNPVSNNNNIINNNNNSNSAVVCQWIDDDHQFFAHHHHQQQQSTTKPCGRLFYSVGDVVQHLTIDHVGGPECSLHICKWRDCSRAGKPFKAKYKLVK